MRLTSFEISNYRAFAAPARVELRELTLLFGYNNVGKSALARVLPLLRDSASGQRGLPLNLESEAARGGEFADLRTKQTGKRQIELTLRWADAGIEEIWLRLQDLPDRRQHVIESFRFVVDATHILEGIWAPNDSGSLEITEYELVIGGVRQTQRIDWRGLVPGLPADAPSSLVQPFGAAASALLSLRRVQWLGAVRAMQPRRSKIPRLRPDLLAPDGRGTSAEGRGAGDVLAWAKTYGEPLFETVAAWYRNAAKAPFDVVLRGDEYLLVIGENEVSLSDTGEGFTQVLPVLTAGAMASHAAATSPAASYVVIEQPELHLHPALHAPLAGYFCGQARASASPRVVIETHSENFLFGVQLAVARGELAPERVIIYWLRQDADGVTSIVPVQLDAEGRPDAWPKDVFTEDTKLARELIDLRRKRAPQ